MTEAAHTLMAPMASFPEGAVVRLGLDRIVASLTNPRKTFNPEKLAELADSIRASGVHSPVLVRPLPGERLQDTFLNKRPGGDLPEFEIVYGERRWRASRLAGVADVPVVVRFLTEDQVLDIQITENLQRDDLLPLEEAEGYQLLMKHSTLSADQVAAKIGRSRAYVYSKLKLLDLCQPARDALRSGAIDASKALLLARIPDETLQVKALAAVTSTNWQGESLSYRAAAQLLQQEYMLKLDQARFKINDATLVAGAGACKDCHKRTGHEPDLFADVKSADVCTFPPCFHRKEEAHSAALVEHAKAKGKTVIAGKEAQEITGGNGQQAKFKGFKRLDLAEDSPTSVPLRKIIGALMKAEGIEEVLIEDPRKKGALVAALPNETVLRLLKKLETQSAATEDVAHEVRLITDEKKAKALARAKSQYEQGWRADLVRCAWDVLKAGDGPAFNVDVHRMLARSAVRNLSTDDSAVLAELLGVGKVATYSALSDFADATPNPDLLHLLAIMQRDSGEHSSTYDGNTRVENVGLMLVARIAFGDRLSATISTLKDDAKSRFLPKVRSPKASTPLPPAAQADGGRGGKAKAKNKNDPAARTAEVPKTSKEHASAQIADAMQALDGSDLGSADAPQSDDAVPVLRQAPEPSSSPAAVDVIQGTGSGAADAAQGDEGQPVLRQAAGTALPFAIGQAVRFKEGIRGPNRHVRKVAGRLGIIEAELEKGVPGGWLVRIGPGAHQVADAADHELIDAGAAPTPGQGLVPLQRVRVNASAKGKVQAPFIGRTGRILSTLGSTSWSVFIDASGRKKSDECIFDSTELEVIAE